MFIRWKNVYMGNFSSVYQFSLSMILKENSLGNCPFWQNIFLWLFLFNMFSHIFPCFFFIKYLFYLEISGEIEWENVREVLWCENEISPLSYSLWENCPLPITTVQGVTERMNFPSCGVIFTFLPILFHPRFSMISGGVNGIFSPSLWSVSRSFSVFHETPRSVLCVAKFAPKKHHEVNENYI